MHRFPFTLARAKQIEVGSGDGLGTTVNLPINWGHRVSYNGKRFVFHWEKFARKIRPELIIISAGLMVTTLFDPVGALGLEVKIMLSSRKSSWTLRVCTLLSVS